LVVTNKYGSAFFQNLNYGSPLNPGLNQAMPMTSSKTSGQLTRTRFLAAIVVVTAVSFIGAIIWFILDGVPQSWAPQHDKSVALATFVGSKTCAGCHQAEAELWRISQHKLAMDHATEQSVLGNFDNAHFEYYGLDAHFFKKGGEFFVDTDGPDGKLTTFQIKYTFGVDPLQQYLIEFPDGRLQALSIAWDSRPKEKGGQRWFHLYPGEQIRHDDVLHWTKLNQNWNHMCAECHSTGVRKNYDGKKDRFATTWAEIGVGCETCHGQGSRHISWAQGQKNWWPFDKSKDPAKGLLAIFDERRDVTWPIDPVKGNAVRNVSPSFLRKEVETCGLCHARRAAFSEHWVPGRWLSDTHQISTLDRQLFHADGQMRDGEETFNYALFKQSKMFAMGVTCSDCHDPHSASLRAPDDSVCHQCHEPKKYEATGHSHHNKMDTSVTCISCHMPERTYMVVDKRHDHSFRIPRPDLSVEIGTPNACNDCHQDKSVQWSAETVDRWFGSRRKGPKIIANTFHSAWVDQIDAKKLLTQIAADGDNSAFLRASVFTELSGRISAADINLARTGLKDPDPMVRIGALDMLEGVHVDQLWSLISDLLTDPVKGARIRAASLLVQVPYSQMPEANRANFDKAAAEFVAAQRLNSDRPEARTTLGNFLIQRGRLEEAESELITALRLNSQFTPAAVNLADLYRLQGRDREGVELLRMAIDVAPKDASLHFTQGLALARLKQTEEALDKLRRAAELAPDQARYVYVYGVGLHSGGRIEDAIAVLKQNLARHPNDRLTLSALISFNHEAGDLTSALDYAERLALVDTRDENLKRFIEGLRLQLKMPGKK
jgi:Flp pilus assembly protein TadD